MALDPGVLNRADQTDEELAARFQDGDAGALETLLRRYQRLAKSKARGYFLVGADADDIEQEALIGLYKAARDFRADRQSSFRAFAELCVTRQVITAIKAATRQKHQPLNRYVSISGIWHSENQRDSSPLEELLDDHSEPDPADRVVAAERFDDMRTSVAQMLSGLEVDVLRLYVEGRTYQEIGSELNRHVKSIDNALQRIKHKMDAHLQARAAADLLV